MFSLPVGKAFAAALCVHALSILPLYKAATTYEEFKSCTLPISSERCIGLEHAYESYELTARAVINIEGAILGVVGYRLWKYWSRKESR